MRKTQNDTVFTTDGEVRKVFPENGTGYELKELYKHKIKDVRSVYQLAQWLHHGR